MLLNWGILALRGRECPCLQPESLNPLILKSLNHQTLPTYPGWRIAERRDRGLLYAAPSGQSPFAPLFILQFPFGNRRACRDVERQENHYYLSFILHAFCALAVKQYAHSRCRRDYRHDTLSSRKIYHILYKELYLHLLWYGQEAPWKFSSPLPARSSSHFVYKNLKIAHLFITAWFSSA